MQEGERCVVVYQEQSEEETEWQGLEEIGWEGKQGAAEEVASNQSH